MTCPNELSFDIATTAGLYSTLAGLLAGFAFTGLVLLLTSRMASQVTRPTAFADATRSLAGAFAALVLCSLNYATLGGETVSAGRATAEEMVTGISFGVSVLLVLHAVVLLLEGVEVSAPDRSGAGKEVASFLRRTVAQVITVLLVVYVYQAVQDYEKTRYVNQGSRTALDVLGLAVTALQISVALTYPFLRKRWTGAERERATRRLTRLFVALAFLGAVGFSLASDARNACTPPPPWVAVVLLLTALAAAATTTHHLARTRP